MTDKTKGPGIALYLGILVAETLVAILTFWMIFPIFRQMLTQLGKPQDIDPRLQLTVIGGAFILQCLYWMRFHWVAIPSFPHSALVAHLFMFASRASFFFGGALFSAIFFRHVPELELLPPIAQGVVKVVAVLAILFSLFCYSLELERLGKAFDRSSREAQ